MIPAAYYENLERISRWVVPPDGVPGDTPYSFHLYKMDEHAVAEFLNGHPRWRGTGPYLHRPAENEWPLSCRVTSATEAGFPQDGDGLGNQRIWRAIHDRCRIAGSVRGLTQKEAWMFSWGVDRGWRRW